MSVEKKLAFEQMVGKPFIASEVQECLDNCRHYKGSAEFREKWCCACKTLLGYAEMGDCAVKGVVHPLDCRLGACMEYKAKVK